MKRTSLILLAALLLIANTTQAKDGGRRGLFGRGGRSAQATVTYHVADSRYGYTHVHGVGQQAAQAYRLAAYDSVAMPAEVDANRQAGEAETTQDVSAEAADSGSFAGDPYGFTSILNRYRASVGLGPVVIDANLSAWASQNNVAQSNRGLGHHINPNCFQNCGWNYATVWGVFQGWLNSPGHRANLLSPTITRIGIAYGPGPYWTMNAQ